MAQKRGVLRAYKEQEKGKETRGQDRGPTQQSKAWKLTHKLQTLDGAQPSPTKGIPAVRDVTEHGLCWLLLPAPYLPSWYFHQA